MPVTKTSQTGSQSRKFETDTKWECKSILDEVGEVVGAHVYPLFGRNHVMSGRCWCHPGCDLRVVPVWNHNIMM